MATQQQLSRPEVVAIQDARADATPRVLLRRPGVCPQCAETSYGLMVRAQTLSEFCLVCFFCDTVVQ